MNHDTPNSSSIDSLLPPEMADKAEQVGVKKANMNAMTMFALAFLAGAFIALGAVFATTVTSGGSGQLPFGVTKLLGGLAFSLGLILVIVGGAELFTGNNLIVMAWVSGKISTGKVLRNWIIVYLGNFAGAIATAIVVFLSGQYRFAGGAIAETALNIAAAKVSLSFVEAVALGALCNVLVCLAVWLAFSARTTTDRVLSIVPPITAFVACSFEHSVANMYFIPIGLFIRNWGSGVVVAADLSKLTWTGFFLNNLLPVTLGNIVGGAAMVGGVYWFIYLRGQSES
ncbi:MAG: formate transporter FocA [Pirellulaceae bacterium]|jgi:formate/nitrite transporter|nr:formate transporter FocA [Pirellulaceae bacterium]MDP6556835.1 formate transporter FocA [Pirellulaceae bacterium]